MYLNLTFNRAQATDGDDFSFTETAYVRVEGDRTLGPSVFAWSPRQLDDLGALFRGVEVDGARQRVGRDLGALLRGLAWSPDEDLLERNDRSGEESLLTVRSSAPELYTLPWEIAPTDASDIFLADHPSVLIRHAVPGVPVRERPAAPAHPGILFGWSDAAGRVPNTAVKEILQKAAEAGGVDFLEVPRVHAGSLQDALDSKPFSVVHLLCHGVPGKKGEPSSLAWGDGQQRPVSAPQLAKLLRPYRDGVRLVVLSACGSGDASQDTLFLGSVAQEIHKKGIPTVVSSRYLLSIPGAVRMTRELYGKLLGEGWSLERSLRYARLRLFRADENGETSEGDAYGMQVYTHAVEVAAEAEGGQSGERPVLSTYPFGTPRAPAPRAAPPRQAVTLVPESAPEAGAMPEEALLTALREVAEDPELSVRAEPSSVPVPATAGQGISQAAATPVSMGPQAAPNAARPSDTAVELPNLTVFYRGADGALVARAHEGGAWRREEPLDAPGPTPPRAGGQGDEESGLSVLGAWGDALFTVFQRGLDGLFRWKAHRGGRWQAEAPIEGGALESQPSVVRDGATGLASFYRGVGGWLSWRLFNPHWHEEMRFDAASEAPCRILGAPAAVSGWRGCRFAIFFRGVDGLLRWKVHHGGRWHGDTVLEGGGPMTSDPAVVRHGSDGLGVFYRGPNDCLAWRCFDAGRWLAEERFDERHPVPTRMASAPAAVSGGASHPYAVFFKGPGGELRCKVHRGGRWQNDAPIEGGGRMSSSPFAVLAPAAPIALWLSVDAAQRIFQARRDGRLQRRLGFAVASLLAASPFAFYGAAVTGALGGGGQGSSGQGSSGQGSSGQGSSGQGPSAQASSGGSVSKASAKAGKSGLAGALGVAGVLVVGGAVAGGLLLTRSNTESHSGSPQSGSAIASKTSPSAGASGGAAAALPASATPPTAAESGAPKAKAKKWWDEVPEGKAEQAKAKIPPQRLEWLKLRALAAKFEKEKKPALAETTLKKALDVARKQLGVKDPAYNESLQLLAKQAASRGKLSEAEKYLREAFEALKSNGDPEAAGDLEDARQGLVDVLMKQGKTEEANQLSKPAEAHAPSGVHLPVAGRRDGGAEEPDAGGAAPAPAPTATDASLVPPAASATASAPPPPEPEPPPPPLHPFDPWEAYKDGG